MPGNLLLWAGAAGVVFFLLAGIILAAVLSRKGKQIVNTVREEYEGGETFRE